MKTIISLTITVLFSIQAGAQDWDQVTKVVASDRSTGSGSFGWSASISSDYAIVGARAEGKDASGGNYMVNAGAAYLFERTGCGNWVEVQKIVASDRQANDYFGYSVSISGNYAIVGSEQEDEDATGGNTMYGAGSAYLFERDSSGNWNQVQKIVASDRAAADKFGWSVSISGNYTIVGAWAEDEDTAGGNTLGKAGSAYLFERDGNGNWNQVQKIVASDRAVDDLFGYAVSISDDYAIVGAFHEDEDNTGGNNMFNSGSAYLFERDSNAQWNQVQKIVATDRAANDNFGQCVSMDSIYVIVGAYQENEDTSGGNTMSNAGSAYLFERDGSGNWNQAQKLVASDREPGDFFGWRVSISGDHAIVSAPNEDEDEFGGNSLTTAGSAYVFERDSTGQWVQVQKIVAPDRAMDDYYGYGLSISGEHIIVGAHNEDEDAEGGNTIMGAGSAYFYETCSIIPLPVTLLRFEAYLNDRGSVDLFWKVAQEIGVEEYVVERSSSATAEMLGIVYASGQSRYDFEDIQPLLGMNYYRIKIMDVNRQFTYSPLLSVKVAGNGSEAVLVYPNPTSGQIHIELWQSYKEIRLSITNLAGQLISSKAFENTSKLDIDLDGLTGYYLINIQLEDGKSAILKVLKQ